MDKVKDKMRFSFCLEQNLNIEDVNVISILILKMLMVSFYEIWKLQSNTYLYWLLKFILKDKQ